MNKKTDVDIRIFLGVSFLIMGFVLGYISCALDNKNIKENSLKEGFTKGMLHECQHNCIFTNISDTIKYENRTVFIVGKEFNNCINLCVEKYD